MPISKATLTKLADLAKVKLSDLEAAQTAEAETDVAVAEDVTSFNKTELETLKNNEYANGKKAGVEIDIKAAKEKLGLEFQGKTIDGLVEAVKAKALKDAKVEPDKKVQELESKIATLQQTITEQDKVLTEKDAAVLLAKTNSELYKYIPEPGDNGPALGKDDIIGLMRGAGYEVKFEDGGYKSYKDGTLIVDKLGNPVPIKDVTTGFLTEKKLISKEDDGVPSGRGGGDKKPIVKATKLSELKAQFEGQGKSLLGEEFGAAVQAAVKDNKDFDLNG